MASFGYLWSAFGVPWADFGVLFDSFGSPWVPFGRPFDAFGSLGLGSLWPSFGVPLAVLRHMEPSGCNLTMKPMIIDERGEKSLFLY